MDTKLDIKRTYIYRYKDLDNTPLCIYLCNTQAKDRILVVPLTPNPSNTTFKLSVTNQFADLTNYKEIKKSAIISPLFLGSKSVKVPETDLKQIQTFILSDIISKIANDAQINNTSLPLFESIYQFLKWKWQKLLLNVLPYKTKTTVYENAIYWASLGVNVGSELNKNRPVLIWKKRCNGDNEKDFSYIIIPITSKLKSRRYYMNVPISINDRQCYLRIEDMRRINIKRISRPILDDKNNILFIDNDKRKEIITAIEKFFVFDNKHKTT